MAKFGLFKKAPSDTVLPAPEHLEFVDDGAAAVLLSTPTRHVPAVGLLPVFHECHHLGGLGRA